MISPEDDFLPTAPARQTAWVKTVPDLTRVDKCPNCRALGDVGRPDDANAALFNLVKPTRFLTCPQSK